MDALFQRDHHRVLDRLRRIQFSEVPRRYGRAQDHRRRVDDILARVLRRRPVHRLEDRRPAAEVGRRREPEPADEPRGEVAEDIAVHVGGHDDVELLGPLDELKRLYLRASVREIRKVGTDCLKKPRLSRSEASASTARRVEGPYAP